MTDTNTQQQPAEDQRKLEQSLNVANKVASGNQFLDTSELPDGVETDTGLVESMQTQIFKDAGVGLTPENAAPVYSLTPPAAKQQTPVPDGFQPSGSALHSGHDYMAVHNDELNPDAYLPQAEPVDDPGRFRFAEPQPLETDEKYATGDGNYQQDKDAWEIRRDTAEDEHDKKRLAYLQYTTSQSSMAQHHRMNEARKAEAVTRGWGSVRNTLQAQGVTPDQISAFLQIAHEPGPPGPNGEPTQRIRPSAHVVMQAIVSEGARIVPVMRQLATEPDLADSLFNMPEAVAARKLGMLIGQAAAQTQQRSANTQQVRQAAAGQSGGYSLLG